MKDYQSTLKVMFTFSCLACTAMALPISTFIASNTQEEQAESAYWGAVPLRGISLPARAANEAEVTQSTKLVPIESYLDADYGTLVYVTPGGQLAATEYPTEFEIRNVAIDDSLESVKFSRFTGRTLRLDGNEWFEVDEDKKAGPLTGGKYDIDLVSSGKDSVVICRIDQISGRTWFMEKGKWKEYKEK